MIENEITITLPLPISVNKAYSGKQKRFKSVEYKEWEEKALISLLKQKRYFIEGDNWLKVVYVFFMPIFCKNGNKKKVDLDNFIKVLQDFLGHNLKGFKDEYIININATKEHYIGESYVNIIIKELDN